MISIYKKCEKSLDNLRGVSKIEDLSSYDRPFLFCISPQESLDKSIFGTIKEGARAARVRTSDELAGGFKIEEMPVDFLGIKHDYKTPGEDIDIVDDFLYPYLKRGTDIKKQARKMNFFTYCNATVVYKNIEEKLKSRLLNDGYSENDIKEILSQISLVSIGSEVDISNIFASAIMFKDVNDGEVFDKISKIALKQMNLLGRETYAGFLKKDNSPAVFTYNGTGNHSLKEYFKDDSLIKCPISAVVSMLLLSSINNSQSDNFIPISSKLLLKRAMQYNTEFEKEGENLLDRLDSELTYGAGRYTKEENMMLINLDKTYLKLIKAEMMLAQEKALRIDAEEKKQVLIEGIMDKSSKVAFQQIVVANGMYNNLRDDSVNYNEMKTDKEIREAYDLALDQEKGFHI